MFLAGLFDSDTGFIKHREVEVGEESLTHADLPPIVTAERLVDDNLVIADTAQQLFQILWVQIY